MTADVSDTAVEIYKDATCLPVFCPVPRRPGKGGVFDKEKRLIRSTLLLRHNFPSGVKPVDRPDLEHDPAVKTERIVREGTIGETESWLKGRYIFGGYFFYHYGHFLLETLTRLWYFKQFPDVPVIWISFEGDDFADWHVDLIRQLGATNEIICLKHQTEVESLAIPEPGYVISSRYWDCQVDALAMVRGYAPKAGKKVWLSRSSLKKGVILNESLLEECLTASGWTIYQPEAHSIADQVKMLADAEEIAGIEGSALHTLVLMPDYRGRVNIFDRVHVSDFEMIADKLGVSQRMIQVQRMSLHIIANTWPNEINSWWKDLDEVLGHLDVVRPSYAGQAIDQRLAAITGSVAKYFGAKNCMELWPEHNTAAAGLAGLQRYLITNRARFDVAAAKQSGVNHFDVRPDVFFATACLRAPIDLFVFRAADEGDNVEQTFYGSLDVSHVNSLWIMDIPVEDAAVRKPFERIMNSNPALSAARIQGSSYILLWRAIRSLAVTSLEWLRRQDLGQGAKWELPTMSLNDVAKQIEMDRKKNRSNAL
ncbi:glycosyltransferase family 61 protein [Kordiimonas sp.]|uniref:glycosyltransferase family 61 protein n=1 Tax=Kordiimonas sp. TaxID=1970157 RepID=UPI003B5206EA